MEYIYNTKNVCARRIKVELDGDVITNVQFLDGGCNGNLQAVPRLVKGLTVEQVEQTLGGIRCGFRDTSCADQLTKAVRAAYEKSVEENIRK